MAKRKYKEACYYCGTQSCTDEHVPPKQMFKGFSCDSITVPSCEEHNTSKGGADQAIVSFFLIPLRNSMGRYSFEREVLQAIHMAQPSYELTKRKAIDSPLFKDPPQALKGLPNLAYLVPEIDMSAWIRQLTAALVYDGVGKFDAMIKWSKAPIWSPQWIAAKGPASVELEQATPLIQNSETDHQLEQLSWENGWSAHPRPYPAAIYAFQIHFGEDHKMIFKHRFYNRFTWYVWFSSAQEGTAKLREKLLR